jgi:flagellar hook protein FlgE
MSFGIALSGLNAASNELDVIGNNVANASTTGFKDSTTQFADIFATSNLGTSANAIGSGVRVSRIAQQFTQGNIGFTNNNLDLAISGQGFFRMSDNGTIDYTRAGSFSVDSNGYVVNASNQRLTGYMADSNGNITGALGDILLDTSSIAPSATGNVDLTLNLDSNSTKFAPYPAAPAFNASDPSTYNNSTSTTIYDSLGNPLLATMYYRDTTNPNVWETHLMLQNSAGTTVEAIPTGMVAGQPASLTFSSSGALLAANPAGTTATSVSYQATDPGTGGNNVTLNLDYAGSTQFGSDFSVNNLSQDGYSTGKLSGVNISATGVMQATFTNGQSRTLAQVALANFNNPQGLRQLGDTTWSESFDSGPALVGLPGTGSLGQIQSGALEGSNVDLTAQLVEMITAQRNFQANAQVITTNNSITQTIINMR